MDGKITIMVIDDEEATRKLVSRAIGSGGYKIISIDNGTSAMKLFKEHHPNLIILDILMPGIDGIQVLQQIRRQSDVPIIMLTGTDDVSSLLKTLEIGADDYIRKPFGSLELLARVKAKLRRVASTARKN